MNKAQVAPASMTFEPPGYFRAEGFDYDHEVIVVLPPSYHTQPDRKYPVMWVLDGLLMLRNLVPIVSYYSTDLYDQQLAPELILVSVGHKNEDGRDVLMTRRLLDYYGPAGLAMYGSEDNKPLVGADEIATSDQGNPFLDFLAGSLRRELGGKYRMSDDHALYGFSGGSAYAAYCMTTRPEAFQRYIMGSGMDERALSAEIAFAESHDDLPVRAFIACGDDEMNDPYMHDFHVLSRTTRFVESLRGRNYPSLKLGAKIYTNETHMTVPARVIDGGLRFIYGE